MSRNISEAIRKAMLTTDRDEMQGLVEEAKTHSYASFGWRGKLVLVEEFEDQSGYRIHLIDTSESIPTTYTLKVSNVHGCDIYTLHDDHPIEGIKRNIETLKEFVVWLEGTFELHPQISAYYKANVEDLKYILFKRE